MASSSSRASRSGQNCAPCACIASAEAGGGSLGPWIEMVARARGAVDLNLQARIGDGVGSQLSLERRQGDALGAAAGAVGLDGEPGGGLLHRGLEAGVGHRLVHQPPLHGLAALHTLLDRAEGVGQVAPHLALVGHAGEAARAGEDGEQRQLGQRNRGAGVVGKQDVVGGEPSS